MQVSGGIHLPEDFLQSQQLLDALAEVDRTASLFGQPQVNIVSVPYKECL
jgi:hypothetical protein